MEEYNYIQPVIQMTEGGSLNWITHVKYFALLHKIRLSLYKVSFNTFNASVNLFVVRTAVVQRYDGM